jgi:hypothetical protein
MIPSIFVTNSPSIILLTLTPSLRCSPAVPIQMRGIVMVPPRSTMHLLRIHLFSLNICSAMVLIQTCELMAAVLVNFR